MLARLLGILELISKQHHQLVAGAMRRSFSHRDLFTVLYSVNNSCVIFLELLDRICIFLDIVYTLVIGLDPPFDCVLKIAAVHVLVFGCDNLEVVEVIFHVPRFLGLAQSPELLHQAQWDHLLWE